MNEEFAIAMFELAKAQGGYAGDFNNFKNDLNDNDFKSAMFDIAKNVGGYPSDTTEFYKDLGIGIKKKVVATPSSQNMEKRPKAPFELGYTGGGQQQPSRQDATSKIVEQGTQQLKQARGIEDSDSKFEVEYGTQTFKQQSGVTPQKPPKKTLPPSELGIFLTEEGSKKADKYIQSSKLQSYSSPYSEGEDVSNTPLEQTSATKVTLGVEKANEAASELVGKPIKVYNEDGTPTQEKETVDAIADRNNYLYNNALNDKAIAEAKKEEQETEVFKLTKAGASSLGKFVKSIADDTIEIGVRGLVEVGLFDEQNLERAKANRNIESLKTNYRDKLLRGVDESALGKGFSELISEGDVSNGIKTLLSDGIDQAPQLALIVASGGTAGMGILGAQSAVSHFNQISDRPDLTLAEKVGQSAAVGLANYWSEKVFQTDIKLWQGVIKSKGASTLIKSAVEEGVLEEGGVALLEQTINYANNGEFNKYAIVDAISLGAGMGSAPLIASKGISALGSKKNSARKQELKSLYTELNKEITQNKDLNPNQKIQLREQVKNVINEYNELVKSDEALYGEMEQKDVVRTVQINQEVAKIKDDIAVTQSPAVKKLLEDKVSSLLSEKDSIEQKYTQSGTQTPQAEQAIPQKVQSNEVVTKDLSQKSPIIVTEKTEAASRKASTNQPINEIELDDAISEAYSALDAIEKDDTMSKEDKDIMSELIEDEIQKLESYDNITTTETRKVAEERTVRTVKKTPRKTIPSREKDFVGKKAVFSDNKGNGGSGVIQVVETPDGKEYYVLQSPERPISRTIGAKTDGNKVTRVVEKVADFGKAFVLGEVSTAFKNAKVNTDKEGNATSVTFTNKSGTQVTVKDPKIAMEVELEQMKQEEFDEQIFEETYIEFVGEETVEVKKQKGQVSKTKQNDTQAKQQVPSVKQEGQATEQAKPKQEPSGKEAKNGGVYEKEKKLRSLFNLPLSKITANSTARASANFFNNILKGDSATPKLYGQLDIPTRLNVFSNVLRLIKNDEIFNSIVPFIPVDVMNDLSSDEFSADELLHNKSMFISSLSINNSPHIISSIIDAIKKSFAVSGAKGSLSSLPRGWDKILNSAIRADELIIPEIPSVFIHGNKDTQKTASKQDLLQTSEKEVLDDAKNNLKEEIKKWMDAQNSSGIAFNPKSSAQQDVALLKAIVDYAVAAGLHTIQQIKTYLQSQNLEVKKEGVNIIAEKIKAKVFSDDQQAHDDQVRELVANGLHYAQQSDLNDKSIAKDIIKAVSNIDVDKLSKNGKKKFYSFVQNMLMGNFTGAKWIATTARNQAGANKFAQLKAKVKGKLRKAGFLPRALGNIQSMVEAITLNTELTSALQSFTGMQNIFNGVAILKKFEEKIEDAFITHTRVMDRNRPKGEPEINSVEQQAMAAWYAFLLQSDPNEFAEDVEKINKSIEGFLKNGGEKQQKDAEILRKLFDEKVAGATSLSDISWYKFSDEIAQFWIARFANQEPAYSDMKASVKGEVYDKQNPLTYTPFKRISFGANEESDLFFEPSYDENGSPIPKSYGNIARQATKPNDFLTRPLAYNFSSEMMKELSKRQLEINIAEYSMQFMGATKNHSEMFGENKTMEQDNISQLINFLNDYVNNAYAELNLSKTEKIALDIANFAGRLGTRLVLGAITQTLKQSTVTARSIANLSYTIGGLKALGQGAGLALLGKDRKHILSLMDKAPIGYRSFSKYGIEEHLRKIPPAYRESIFKTISRKALKPVDDATMKASMFFLEKTDAKNARLAWAMYYADYLYKNGQTKIDWEAEANEPNIDAVAYAETMIAKTQMPSDIRQVGEFASMTPKSDAGHLFKIARNATLPFLGFPLNRVNTQITNFVKTFYGDSTAATRKQAMKDTFGIFLEEALFRSSQVAIGVGVYGASTYIAALFGLDFDDDEEENKKKWEKEGTKILAGAAMASTMPMYNIGAAPIDKYLNNFVNGIYFKHILTAEEAEKYFKAKHLVEIKNTKKKISQERLNAYTEAALLEFNKSWNEAPFYNYKYRESDYGKYSIAIMKAADIKDMFISASTDGEVIDINEYGNVVIKKYTKEQKDAMAFSTGMALLPLLGAPTELNSIANAVAKKIRYQSKDEKTNLDKGAD